MYCFSFFFASYISYFVPSAIFCLSIVYNNKGTYQLSVVNYNCIIVFCSLSLVTSHWHCRDHARSSWSPTGCDMSRVVTLWRWRDRTRWLLTMDRGHTLSGNCVTVLAFNPSLPQKNPLQVGRSHYKYTIWLKSIQLEISLDSIFGWLFCYLVGRLTPL